jgi:hypothetical protein
MPTGTDILRVALAENGYHDGQGYDEPSKYAQSFGINSGIAYCDIFVSWVYERAGAPLPKMGSWIRSGAQYCPDNWAYADNHRATVSSWLARPGFQCIFDWTGTGNLGPQSHTEVVEKWENGVLYTVGGNSGPSNVDGFTGTGGVHRHAWSAPFGVGNDLIMGVIDTSKFVHLGGAAPASTADHERDVLARLARIDPGRDVGHPKTTAFYVACMRLINPKFNLSTRGRQTQALKQLQAIWYNDWQLKGGPHPERVTGIVDDQTRADLIWHACGEGK